MTKKIAVLVGSLRRESYNRKLAKALMALAPETLELELVEIGGLPLFNQDYDDEGTTPPVWQEFRQQVKTFDGVLFITPEHNRSVPAALKNALDVGSRPYGQNVWAGKPGGIITLSIGAVGGFGANHHLRQTLVFLDVPTMAQPEAYISNAGQQFNAAGNLSNEATRDYLAKFMNAFAAWVAKF